MSSPQEQIGKAIMDLKKLYPNMSAAERADMVFSNTYFLGAISSVNGNGVFNGHK